MYPFGHDKELNETYRGTKWKFYDAFMDCHLVVMRTERR